MITITTTRRPEICPYCGLEACLCLSPEVKLFSGAAMGGGDQWPHNSSSWQDSEDTEPLPGRQRPLDRAAFLVGFTVGFTTAVGLAAVASLVSSFGWVGSL